MLSAEASGKFYIVGKVWKDGEEPHIAGLVSKCFSFAISELQEEMSYLSGIGRSKDAEEKEEALLLLYDPAFSSAFAQSFKHDGLSVADSIMAALDKTSQASALNSQGLEELTALMQDAFEHEDYITSEESSDDYILVVKKLSLETLKKLDSDAISLVICEKGSASSHAAMFLRTLGIPALFGVAGIYDKVLDGDILRVDCFNSGVISGNESWIFDASASLGTPEDTTTKDGKPIRILATINQAQQARSVSNYTWDGIGLVRTEFLFARTEQEPSIRHQSRVYSSIANWTKDGNIHFRLFDFGDDKEVSWIGDANRDEVYERQIEALLSASEARTLSILIPKASSRDQVEMIRALIAKKVGTDRLIRLGSMIETLSGVSAAEGIIEASDFINIGTNDLSAESIGVNRDEADASTVFMEPKFLKNMEIVLSLAYRASKPVTVCGEMMGSRHCCYLLVGLGIEAMSVELRKIPETRSFISAIDANDAKKRIKSLIECKTLEDVHSLLIDLAY